MADQIAPNSLSIVVPARNEEATISEVVERSFRAFEEMGREGEVLVVNDGSTDNTGLVLDQLSERYADLPRDDPPAQPRHDQRLAADVRCKPR